MRYVICDAARLVDREHTYELLGHGFGILGQIVVIHREAAADKRNNAILADALLLVGQRRHIGGIRPAGQYHMLRPRTIKPLHRHAADAALRLADLLLYAADDADGIHIFFFRNVYRDIFLRHEKNISVPDHGHFQRAERRLTLDVKGKDHVGEHGKPAQGYHRQFFGSGVCFAHSFSFPEWVKISGQRELSLARCRFSRSPRL